MPFWALSLLFHVAGLLLVIALVPLASRDAGHEGGVSVVLRAEALCVGSETEEDVLDMECLESPPPLSTALWTLTSATEEEESEVEDPFEETLEELVTLHHAEVPFFVVPLEAARRRVPQASRSSAPIGPPPAAPPRHAAPASKPATRSPAMVSPRATAATASARPATSARPARRAARRGQGGRGQRSLRIRYTPRILDYYPRLARRRGYEGTVIVLMVIDAQGTVVHASLSQSSGHTSLDDAALRIARAYRFVPPGVERRARLPIAFSLQRG